MIFVAYLSALCQNPLHTATQYALLTALAAVGRTYLSSGAGFVAEATGWVWFFVICALAGAAEPRAALVAAGARAFRPARAGENVAPLARGLLVLVGGTRSSDIALRTLLRSRLRREHLPLVAAVPLERLAVALSLLQTLSRRKCQPVHFISWIVPQSPAPRAL